MLEFIKSAVAATIPLLGVGHFVRKDGSYVKGQSSDPSDEAGAFDVILWLEDQEWSEVTDDLSADVKQLLAVEEDGCRYFRATIEEDAWCAAVHVSTLTDEELDQVRLRRGRKGNIEMTAPIEPVQTDVIHLITGPYEGQTVVYTWYPGEVTPADRTVKLGDRG